MVSSVNAQDKDQDKDKVNFSKEELNFAESDVSPMDQAIYKNKNKETVARVIYSRPLKRDREIFGKLVPYGKVWRTGANETTELTLYKNMEVGNETVQAGTYSIYTVPNENEWTVILNKKINTWGAMQYAEKEDMVRINVPVRQSPNTIESLSMAFQEAGKGADLLIGWDDRYIKVPFKDIN